MNMFGLGRRGAPVVPPGASGGFAAPGTAGVSESGIPHAVDRLEHEAAARRFALGTRTVADLLAPAAIEVGRTHVRLDHQYARTLVVTGYPRTVSAGWLAPLIDFEEPIEISLHVHPLETGPTVRLLNHRLVQLHSSRLLDARGGRLADPEREVAYEDVERLRDALQRGDEKVFSVSLYLLLRAGTPAALDDLTRRVEALLDAMLARSRVAVLEQDGGFRSCLPEGHDRLLVYRNLDTSSLATTFPFCSTSLSMDRGVLYGIAIHNHSPVIIDPFDQSLENANTAIVATSGAGKSYFTKLMALRSLLAGVDFIVIDPEDEYRALCAAVGGQRVHVAGTSSQHLNPFDLTATPAAATIPVGDAVTEGAASAPGNAEEARTTGTDARVPDAGQEGDALAEQVAALLGLLEVMLTTPDEPLTTRERAVLDRALYQTYAQAGITADPATHTRTTPLLRDLHAVLTALSGPNAAGTALSPTATASATAPTGGLEDVAAQLAMRLRRYVEGSLAGLFSAPTNVALSGHFVVFDLQALDPELQPLAIHLITGFVWKQVHRHRRPRLLVVDEAWSLLQYPEGGRFLAGMARRARKYWLGLVTISQQIADFLGAEHGRTVLANAAVKLLMKHDSASVGLVTDAFELSVDERQLLLSAGKGEGLLLARGDRIALKIEASPLEHRLATTTPQELAEQTRQMGQTHTSAGEVAWPAPVPHAIAPTPVPAPVASASATGVPPPRRRLGLLTGADGAHVFPGVSVRVTTTAAVNGQPEGVS